MKWQKHHVLAFDLTVVDKGSIGGEGEKINTIVHQASYEKQNGLSSTAVVLSIDGRILEVGDASGLI